MNLSELQNAVYTWARNNGILAPSVVLDEVGDVDLVPFGPEAADYFRTRYVTRVAVEENASRLIIFSRLSIAKTKQKRMIDSFASMYEGSGIKLRLDVSKPFKVDQAVNSFGVFEPIQRYSGRICCGSSVGLGNQRNAGTLTALVKKTTGSKSLYGISCNHVLGGCSTARPETPIVVPGIQDVSSEHQEINLIGFHDSTATMSQGLPSVFDVSKNRDLACFRLKDEKILTSLQGSGSDAYDTPAQFIKPKIEMPVKKWGRSTGLTEGEISFINESTEPIDYKVDSYFGPMNSQTFRGTVYFTPVIEVSSSGGRPFSLGGDSGALVVTNYRNKKEKVVGILIGGEKTKSFLLPLQPALRELGLTLVNNHNT